MTILTESEQKVILKQYERFKAYNVEKWFEKKIVDEEGFRKFFFDSVVQTIFDGNETMDDLAWYEEIYGSEIMEFLECEEDDEEEE